MALSGTDALASFDVLANKKADISPVLSSILLHDTATLGLLGMGPAVQDKEHKWGKDSLLAPSVVSTVALPADGSTAVTFSVADARKLRIGALLQDAAAGKVEVMQLISIDYGTGVGAVTRDYDGGGEAAHLVDAVFNIIGQPVQEADKTSKDISKDREQDGYNYTQIFKRFVEVSGSQEAIAQAGLIMGVASEARHQILNRSMELAVEMNLAALYSIRSASAGSDSVYRTMGGMRQFIVAGGNVDPTAEAISVAGVVDDLYGLCWDKGGDPSVLLGHANQMRKFSAINTERFRVAPSDRVVGVFIEKYLTTYGRELSLVSDRWHRTDEVELVDPARMYLAPLQGRAMFTEPLAKTGDAMSWQMIAELTLVLKNAAECFAIHTALTP